MSVVERAADETDLAVGNAAETGRSGWFLGPFLPGDAGIRSTDRIQLKWGVHRAGEERADISDSEGVCSAAVLVSGSFVLHFPTKHRQVVLDHVGDYVVYGPGVPHGWRAIADSVVLTARWPAAGS